MIKASLRIKSIQNCIKIRFFKTVLHNTWKTFGEDKVRFDFHPCGLVKVCIDMYNITPDFSYLLATWKHQ